MKDFLEFLKTRRSVKPAQMAEPGPTNAEIEEILTVASRVPDHGKYAPWYFIVFNGEARRDAGELVREAYLIEHGEAAPAKLELEAERFLTAPTIIAVISRIKPGKHSEWEQVMSAGASCMNLILAANALGYASNWLTPWFTYSEAFQHKLGLDAQDRIAGFIYIGTAKEKPEERERPRLEDIVTYWRPLATLQKGDQYSGKKI